MFINVKYDYRREYEKHADKGKIRAWLNCLLAQGFFAVLGYRFCRWLVDKKIPVVNIFVQKIVEVLTGISIPPGAVIGKGLLIEHFGGIVINARTIIGDYCTISHEVTIGNRRPGGGAPTIGNNVYICVGAKLLGDITIGDNCVVGANSVVLSSIPANSIVAGVPAKVIRSREIGEEQW